MFLDVKISLSEKYTSIYVTFHILKKLSSFTLVLYGISHPVQDNSLTKSFHFLCFFFLTYLQAKDHFGFFGHPLLLENVL